MDEEIEVRVRRAPRYGMFIGFGALLGVVGAMVMLGFSDRSAEDGGQLSLSTFGFFAIAFALTGILLGGLAAIVFDRLAQRGIRTAQVMGVFEEVPPPAARPGADAPPRPRSGADAEGDNES